jgi:PST family polysaccharide transporter
MGALGEATLEGARWVTIGRVIVEILSLGATVLLAHLISPAAFGQAVIAGIVTTVALALTIGGFATPIVQRREAEPEFI